MTDPQKQVDSPMTEAIENTVESGHNYRDFVHNERESREDQKIQETVEERIEEIEEEAEEQDEPTVEDLEENFEANPQLDALTGRVTELSFNSRFERIEITFEDVDGTVHSDEVNAGLPEDKENKYVRLCEWTGVDPKYPSELRGKKIPLTRSDDDNVEIHYPPIQTHLNPYSYKLKRSGSRVTHYIESRERLSSALSSVGFVFACALPAIGYIISLLLILFISSDVGGNGTLLSVIKGILFLPTLVLSLISGGASLALYGRAILYGLLKALDATVKGLGKAKEFLFPSADK